ncbi:hypothetical protein TYRP_001680 [Tyrophagus putrescentiae]|nr:hypothetical protein TYRP_001680 [Tyrophagus putrescentiae]
MTVSGVITTLSSLFPVIFSLTGNVLAVVGQVVAANFSVLLSVLILVGTLIVDLVKNGFTLGPELVSLLLNIVSMLAELLT